MAHLTYIVVFSAWVMAFGLIGLFVSRRHIQWSKRSERMPESSPEQVRDEYRAIADMLARRLQGTSAQATSLEKVRRSAWRVTTASVRYQTRIKANTPTFQARDEADARELKRKIPEIISRAS